MFYTRNIFDTYKAYSIALPMERITGSIDRIMPQSCYARIVGQDGEYYSFWHDGSCGSVSKNQEYLIAYLDNHTGDIEEWPLVVFTPKSGEVENIAFDVEWVKEPDLKFALPVSLTNGIPLRPEGKHLWFVYDQPLDPHLVTEGDLYWFQIHRGKEKRGKFIVKSSVNNIEHLVGRKDVQTVTPFLKSRNEG